MKPIIAVILLCLAVAGCRSSKDTCTNTGMVGYGHNHWQKEVRKINKQ